MLVKTILRSKPVGLGVVTVHPAATIAEAARLLATHRIGALLAVETDGTIAGILSERDIVRGIAQMAEAGLNATVRDRMTTAVLTCREDDTIENLMEIMTERRIRHLPVLDILGRLVGMVTIGDVVKSRLEYADMEVDNLRHYVAAAR